MKAFILNSGVGRRMGEITKSHPKCMTTLSNHETIFGRQLRILNDCGIKNFVITTGPWPEQLKHVASPFEKKGCHFDWIENPIYDKTNYIQSCYFAKDKIYGEDILSLHGDLVFNKKLIQAILLNKNPSVCLINKNIEKPKKDFKGRIIDGKLREVGINIFDGNCFALQPLYKLSKSDTKIWLDSISDFIENKKINNVYAENAFNAISSKMNIIPFFYENFYINEIDDLNDYSRVKKEIQALDYKEQEIISISSATALSESISNLRKRFQIHSCFFVVDSFLLKEAQGIIQPDDTIFDEFTPNPKIEEVKNGIDLFSKNQCDGIIAIGGGSAIDVAKAIKLYLPFDNTKGIDLLRQHTFISIKLIAVPTTAGTGSESTRYAVIYKNGEKLSLTDDLLLPDVAILDTIWLKSLPLAQKKATLFDALCHSIESMWSINSCDDSEKYAEEAISIILSNIDNYFNGDTKSFAAVQKAANLAGKAINLTQTTAAHAMSYKITEEFHIPHGQAVAICLPQVWQKLIESKADTFDPRGEKQIENVLVKLDKLFECHSHKESLEKYISLMKKYSLFPNIKASRKQVEYLTNSVNPIRLRNFPIQLNSQEIQDMYQEILG